MAEPIIDPEQLRCAVWNIHRARWNDGRVDPAGTLKVLLDEVWSRDLDALILIEADGERPPHEGLLDLGRLERESGLRSVHGPERLRWGSRSHGFLGTIMLLHPRLIPGDARVVDLPGVCHRGAIVQDVRIGDRGLRLVAAHLSLGQPARIAQMRTIGQVMCRLPAMPTVLCGDLNEWRPWSGLAFSRRVAIQRWQGPVRRTFPTRLPLLPLDRVLGTGGARVTDFAVLDGPGIRRASDHRPIRAAVTFD